MIFCHHKIQKKKRFQLFWFLLMSQLKSGTLTSIVLSFFGGMYFDEHLHQIVLSFFDGMYFDD